MEVLTSSKDETTIFGQEVGKSLKGSEVILLNGDLGSGKTAFVQGVAKGLGISKHVTSPTFVIMKKYKVRGNENDIKKFVHIDTYRGLDIGELADSGALEDFGDKKTVVLVEWGVGLGHYLKTHNIKFYTFKIDALSRHKRRIMIDENFELKSKFF
ncbi:tRNA (adenosine(37)-N6)-threonylcarbamoyltransferase complex ATPase subunit type 1 TsaE [Candidatus Falkowbacteria bacterium]|jgi:tRNA threonylcarbamoyladenosine biosynthesis protein TsaE|nr:tRNA (adenosine(37)-N6)-threonylcarbamoyltransferase complex ATPase subunit type 1 TsaE [Candidatus Falkowbacteria bacterium]MBT7007573.1 tRNA (adenosine(37)-N6)-threonylcarbamoyltransferase complex ATPase subunit type 1 TsaE [Candidatus Falkowbacteria bacterium]